MNRLALALFVALVVSIALAAIHVRDAQRERARADALALRLAEHEPLEKGGSPLHAVPDSTVVSDVRIEPPAEPTPPASTEIDSPTPAKPIMAYRGTHRARQFVDRLQSALASGTPLQDYQIQPLIDAIDQAGTPEDGNARIIQAALPILFESQLDQLIALLQAGELGD